MRPVNRVSVGRERTAAYFVCAAVLLFSGCGRPGSEVRRDPVTVLGRAVGYLWSQQADDGGWHSQTHGLLKGGQAWTPFTTFYLFQVPDSIFSISEAQRDRALQFIRKQINEDGAVGLSDPTVLEYPNYSTSYAVRVLRNWGQPLDSALVRKMTRYLLGQQFVEERGIEPSHRAYGAWGFGETGLGVGATGHIDLSHTRRVLEAVASEAELRGVSESRSEAIVYLRMLQKHPREHRSHPLADSTTPSPPYDGGFYASTTALGINKAGTAAIPGSPESAYFRSYATATCDGLLALLAAGVDRADERVQSARRWLAEHDSLETVPGIPSSAAGAWEDVLFYYHLLVRSEVLAALEAPGDWRQRIQRILAARQRPDGSFLNPLGGPNKEDDPILATTMAVGVLINTLR